MEQKDYINLLRNSGESIIFFKKNGELIKEEFIFCEISPCCFCQEVTYNRCRDTGFECKVYKDYVDIDNIIRRQRDDNRARNKK